MTRSAGQPTPTLDGQFPSVLVGMDGVDGKVAQVAEVRAVRERLADLILPGATDTAASASKRVQAQWVDLLGELEALKNTVAATQARLAVALEEATKSTEAKAGIRAVRRGRGVPSQVGAAMQASPHAGGSFLGTARAWVTGMPYTFDALRTGVLSQWRATLLVQQTAHLSAEHRAWIDEEICGPAGLATLARLGTKRLIAKVKELAARLDVQACVKRLAKAKQDRCVSVRPAADLMVYLTALVPMQQGVQAYAQLKKQAEAAKATGDERGTGQIMADTLIERVTGREPGHADDVPVTINLLVSDQTLLTNTNQPGTDQAGTNQPGTDRLADEPAVVVEGAAAGAGTVPGPVARNLVAHAIDIDSAWLRAIYVDPRGRLLATSSVSRFHPPGLVALLRAREQGICATAWCDAPVRHIDHVVPHADGGQTSLENGQGLCARCNHAKQAPGWTQQATDADGRQAVQTVTPTGHTYTFVAPTPPEPVREVTPAWTPAIGMNSPNADHTPPSRYTIGCSAPRHSRAIAYRPPGRRRTSNWRAPADIAWTHPAVVGHPCLPCPPVQDLGPHPAREAPDGSVRPHRWRADHSPRR